MVIVSAITNVFFSLIIIIISAVELFFILIGILDIVGIFLMGILNIIYACMRLYALRVQQRLIENNQVTYYNKCIALRGASLPKGIRQSRGSGKSRVEPGTVLEKTLRSMQQPMRQISWAASLYLLLPVDNYENTEPEQLVQEAETIL